MGLIEGLFEWAAGLTELIGVFILLLFIGAGVFVIGTLMVLIPGALLEAFTHDKNFDLIPSRVAVVILVVWGLFMIRWYLPSAAAGSVGLVGLFIEITGIWRLRKEAALPPCVGATEMNRDQIISMTLE